MQSKKYYDYKSSKPIDISSDGCSLDEWSDLYGKALFAKHPKGFLVFLPPDELDISDEYKDSDPYTVEINKESKFHERRIGCTLELLQTAVNSNPGKLELLDLGCGQGHITYKIQQMFPDAEISGIDYSISAVDYAVDHFPGIDFSVGNAYEPPYADNYFDIIVCNNLWEHVPDPLVLLTEITRILKPHGHLIISTPSRYRLGNLLRTIKGKPISFMSKHHVTEYSVGQVYEQLRYGGYEVVSSASKQIGVEKSLKSKIAKFILSKMIVVTGSHHNLESTVFYLAKNVRKQQANTAS